MNIINNHFPKVSIITPSFQQGEYLEETILSVLNQTYPNIEYIIIDGGSTDNSIEIIKKYSNRITCWVSEKDNGQADAINKGFRKASGDFICWVNSDDLLYPDFIYNRINQFRQYPQADFIYGDVHQGKSLNTKILRKGKSTDFHSMLTEVYVPVPQQSAIWKRSITEKVGLLNEKWQVILDREYYMRIARYCRIQYLPGSVAFFRNHDKSKSIQTSILWADEILILYDEILMLNSFELDENHLVSIRNKALVNSFLKVAEIFRVNGSAADYRKFLRMAFKTNKFMAFKKILQASILRLLVRIKKQSGL